MKKKLLYIAAIVICLSLITGGTYAYFTASDTARNVITSGGIEVKVVEQQLVNGTLQPYPSQPIPVMPATMATALPSSVTAAWCLLPSPAITSSTCPRRCAVWL